MHLFGDSLAHPPLRQCIHCRQSPIKLLEARFRNKLVGAAPQNTIYDQIFLITFVLVIN